MTMLDTDAFFDKLSALCASELSQAKRSEDPDRVAGLIQGLATMLGRTIARSCDGEGATIDTMLMGAEQLAASEAAGFAGLYQLAKGRKK